MSFQGIGAKPAATQPDMQTPKPALHAKMAGGAPKPPVMVPKTKPAPA